MEPAAVEADTTVVEAVAEVVARQGTSVEDAVEDAAAGTSVESPAGTTEDEDAPADTSVEAADAEATAAPLAAAPADTNVEAVEVTPEADAPDATPAALEDVGDAPEDAPEDALPDGIPAGAPLDDTPPPALATAADAPAEDVAGVKCLSGS